MRRFGQWVFNLLAAASLLLCVVTVGLWVRSESTLNDWTWQTTHVSFVTQQDVVSNRGHLFFDRIELPDFGPQPPWPPGVAAKVGQITITPLPLEHRSRRSEKHVQNLDMISGRSIESHNLLGFLVIIDNEEQELSRYAFISVPYWGIVVGSIALPTIWVGRWLHRRRRRQFGLCLNCGYDLRATPDRCPECGKAVPVQRRFEVKTLPTATICF
jgi:RNA polymerase subunit RPABC4/transcription elongation factor Spt4